jgi:flagellar hook-length control protein FliK
MDIDISIVRKGSDMEKTTFDMQASLNPQEGIGFFRQGKSPDGIGCFRQGKSPVGRPDQSTSFNSVLDEKTAEVINDEGSIGKSNEDSDSDDINPDFTVIPLLNPMPSRMTHPLQKDGLPSETEVTKSIPLMDKMKLAVLSFPTSKNRGNFTEDTQQTAMSVPTEMTDEANHNLLEDPVARIVKSPFTGISEIIQSQPGMVPPSGQDASMTVALGKNSLPSLGLSGIRARNNVKSDIQLTPEKRNQADLAQANDAVSEPVSGTLVTTVADTPFPEVDSLSGDHETNHIRTEKSGHQTEAESMDRVSEELRQKDNKSAADSVFPDLRRATISRRDNTTDSATQKEGYIATANQKPTTAVNDRAAATGQSTSEGLSQVELADTAVFMKNSAAGATAADQENQQNWNASSDRNHSTTNRTEFPLRAEMTNILSGNGNRLTVSEGPAGINTQAVIDQILDAKQSMNNGFGRVRITLDPPNLGTVNLEIVVRKERVEVVMTADNSGVQQALQSRVDDIRTALQRQDLKIENFQILLQDNAANQQQANSGATFGQRQEHQARQNLMDGNIPTQPLIQAIRESEPARGLVSIFV